MILLIVTGITCLLFALICAIADSRPPIEPDDDFDQPRHVRVLDDQEHNV